MEAQIIEAGILSKEDEDKRLARGLSNRHLQLIAIGGAIGTGLFLGSGKSISLAGPSILLAYTVTGFFIFLIMRALGELLLSNFKYHSFVDFTKDYLGERWAFVLGWTYWILWVFIAVADLTAVGLYAQYWFGNDFPIWIPAMVMLAILVASNMLTVKLFGEFEFWFALIKIIAIIGLILAGGYLIFTNFSWTNRADGEVIVSSFSHLWDRGGFFSTGFVGFLLSFQMVIFAFAGVELVGLAAGETKDPEKNLPKAVNNVPIRIFLFYILSLSVIMSIYPWDIVNPKESPFVNVFAAAGITAAATLINIVVLTSAASAANSALFSTSRMLFSSAKHGDAPTFFSKINARQVPQNSLLFSTALIVIFLLTNVVVPNGATVFVYVSSIVTMCFLFIWATIIICHIKYKKTRPQLAAASKFKMPFAPISNYLVLGFLLFALIVMAFDKETLIGYPISIIGWLILLVAYQIRLKTLAKRANKN